MYWPDIELKQKVILNYLLIFNKRKKKLSNLKTFVVGLTKGQQCVVKTVRK